MTQLTSVTIPNSVTNIGSSAFNGCTSLKKVNYTGDVRGWLSINMIGEYSNPIYYSRNLYINDALLTDLVIPNGVTEISYSFAYDTCITSVTIPNNVTSIGEEAFDGCTGLTSVVWNAKKCGGWSSVYYSPFYSARGNITSFTFGNEVDSIPSYLCSGMSNLTSITIPNSVTIIGEYAFEGCTNIQKFTFPANLTTIGYYALKGCTSLTSVVWNVKNIADFSFDKMPFYNSYYKIDLRSQITSFTFGDEVECIPANLCYGMSKLTSITIPNSVTSIGEKAFNHCTGLTSVTIGNGVTSIGKYAFYNCTGLTSVTIGNSVTSIGSSILYGCTSLTAITIGSSVTRIEENAFKTCTGLKKVNYTGDVRGWLNVNMENVYSNPIYYSRNLYINDVLLTDVVIPDGVTEISAAFAYDNSITSVTIPNSVTSIGNSAFYQCRGLTSVTIGNGVTSIGDYAFYYCTGLTSVTIGNSVTNIGNYAFRYCTGLTSMRVDAKIPPQCGDNSFYNVPQDIPLYVPCGTKEAYQADAVWSSFTNIIDHEYSAIVQPSANGSVETVSYTCGNELTIQATADEHYHFAQWSDGNTDNPRTFMVFQDTTLIAEFAIDQHTISASSENGRVEGTGLYDYGSTAVLYAYADEHYHFEHWNDGNTDNPRVVPVEAAAAYTAVFAIDQFTITATAEGNGYVSGDGTYDYGVEVILYAIADEHYHFTQWSDGNTDNPRSMILECDASYRAIFVPNQYTISAIAENGYVEGTGEYDYGTTATLTAIADEHYHFTQWSDGNTDNPRTVSVDGEATYTAIFAPNKYAISATAENGYVEGTGEYDYGATATLTAIADEHYHFTQWNDGNTDNPRTVSVDGEATYTAIFVPNQYTISAIAENGYVEGTGEYDYRTTATLTAVANEHYHFTQWSDGNTDNPRTVSVEGNATYTAEFAIDQFTITATCDIQYGEITGDGVYDYGTRITLTAIPNSGYEFKQWSNGLTYNPYRFTVVSDLTLEAEFIPATAIDNISADTDTTTPQKVLIDGQVYILRNNKTYTTMGMEVK